MTLSRALLLFLAAFGALFALMSPSWTKQAVFSGIQPYTVAVAAIESAKETSAYVYPLEVGIPRIIVMTYRKHGPLLRHRARLWQKLNPSYRILQFDDDECASFLAAAFDDDTKTTFLTIRDGPIKADMFRVFYLLEKGGIYVDVDMIPVSPLLLAMPTLNDSSSQLLLPWSRHENQLNPTVIAASPKHPTLKLAAQMYMTMGRGHYYSYWSWSVVHVLSALYLSGAPMTLSLHEKCLDETNLNTCGLYRGDQLHFFLRGAGYFKEA